jgi:hypothetical protein
MRNSLPGGHRGFVTAGACDTAAAFLGLALASLSFTETGFLPI